MFVKDCCTQSDQRNTGDSLGDPSEPLSDEATDQHAARRHQEGCHADARRNDDDVDLQKSQRHADSHGIETGADRRRNQHGKGHADLLLFVLFVAERGVEHVEADGGQQSERDPVVHCRHETGSGDTCSPADQRRDRLDDPEDDTRPDRLAQAWTSKRCARPTETANASMDMLKASTMIEKKDIAKPFGR